MEHCYIPFRSAPFRYIPSIQIELNFCLLFKGKLSQSFLMIDAAPNQSYISIVNFYIKKYHYVKYEILPVIMIEMDWNHLISELTFEPD
jgi:hypothetical protein